jgi:hypothetical protein
MKYYIYLLTILLVSCGEPAQSPSSPYKVDSLPAPDHVTIPYTTAEIPHEKHFDCWIVEKITGNRDDEDMYVTECGIPLKTSNLLSTSNFCQAFDFSNEWC